MNINGNSVCDFYAMKYHEILNEEILKKKMEELWDKIWRNRNIPLNKKKQKFKKEFSMIIKQILDELSIFLKAKILKVYESLEDVLEEYANKLEKEEGGRSYKPDIPSAKEIYKEVIMVTPDEYQIANILAFNMSALPYHSLLIEIIFKLKKSYLSKDDDNFYIIDNPIVKDKVFKLPMVRATTWKGALRFAAIKVFENWIYEKLNNSEKLSKDAVFNERAKIIRLFGNEKNSQENYMGKLCLLAIEGKVPDRKELGEKIRRINEDFEKWLIDRNIISKDVPSRAGRLFFYPTFFDKISLEVITPLRRETKTPVHGPIYFEVVPADETKGVFRLLYYPFDLIAKGEFDKIEDEMKEDLEILSKALKKMFCEIGFSAKKTSGFGLADIDGVEIWCGDKLKSLYKIIEEIFCEEFSNVSVKLGGDSDEK